MLTIGQLAAYAGTTVRAVRHYHQIGLLPEPERTYSGYRTYDAAAVVRLIRIRTLAEAGVPLARVQNLMEATPEEFAEAVVDLDRQLRAQIRRLQHHRDRIARLATGESLALPQVVVDYLGRLRGLGVDERIIALERDAWIMLAAYGPDRIDQWIAQKQDELADPDTVRLYLLMGGALDWPADDDRVVELADLLERLMVRSLEAGVGPAVSEDPQDPFIDLMDTHALEAAPAAGRLMQILEERGWKGWTRLEEVPRSRAAAVRG
jgi:DNA-binding transcriptional MerR regulator